ncbi:AbrB family transcriptional regulator [Candidatus Woesearchaeota archaeon CG10_big_fil_rev_8_21_14_0_10_37_12]|nr:MAG: AbrB family transcriptional regulator [Candidatus Woesearchaeota archaeon CG10_big_fil_rev_8_21_14_0_10_37_12]
MNSETVEVTSMSSRGQIVIPHGVREKMHLVEGEKFVVMGSGDTILLKKIHAPPKEQFERLLRETRKHVKESGITPQDVEDAIKRVRARKKK